MASSTRPSPAPPSLDLEITIISAKHLKNVNWRHAGDLSPYAVVSLTPDRRLSTPPSDTGHTKPVWNHRLLLPLPPSPPILAIDLFHLTTLIGSNRSPLADLIIDFSSRKLIVHTLPISRPSGRPQGKIRVSLQLRDAAPYPPQETSFPHPPPPASPYYYQPPPYRPGYYQNPNPSAPPPQYGGYSDPYYPATAGYYSAPQEPVAVAAPARGYAERELRHGGPSAPAPGEYGYEKGRGAVVGGMGRLNLDEGGKHEGERVESDFAARDDYSDYRADY